LNIGGVLRLGQFTTANAPSGTEGALYFNTAEKKPKIYSDSAWNDLGGGWDGVLPNYTTAQRNALSLADGLIVYNTTDNAVQIYKLGAWANVGAKLSLAATCSLDGDCDSTHCKDGVCCNKSCTGGCEACNLTSTIGVCTVRAADDTTESPPACQRCDGINGAFQLQTANDGYLCTQICKVCSSGSCVNANNAATDTGCTATHYRCDGAGLCTAPCSGTVACVPIIQGLNCCATCSGYCMARACVYPCTVTCDNCNNIRSYCGCWPFLY